MDKTRRFVSCILVFSLIMSMTLFMSSCGKKAEEAPAEETKQEEEQTIYGDESLGIDAKVDEALSDYRNILLLGIDNGNRSDLMMILSINEKTHEIKSVAVHRDTYMQIAEDGTYTIDGKEREFYKCNRAYKRDGIYGAMKELNRHMDLNIKECVAIDWAGMAKFMDSMGGIEGYIDENMLEFINGNKPTDDPSVDYKVDGPGQQHLSGWQAVQYLRARKYTGGTAPKRDDRNQDALLQLFDKAKKMDIQQLSDVYEGVASDIETNMSRNTLTDTLGIIADSTLEGTPGWPYEYSELWQDDNSYYYFVADTLASNVTELHKTLFGQENYEPSETVMTLNDKLETARKEQLH